MTASTQVSRVRRRRMIQLGVLLLLIIAGNGPFAASWATAQYAEWQSHQPDYMRGHGRWDIVADSGTRSIHAAMLRTGKVLLMAGSGNDQGNFDAQKFTTVLWDPIANTFADVYTPWDVFCAGHAFLPNGNLLIAGGTKKYELLAQDSPDGKKHEYQGLKDSYIFNPGTERYEKTGELNHARWYPTLVTLADGTVVSVSGLDENGDIDQGNTELFSAATRMWKDHPDLKKVFPTYPSLLLAADGRLFFSGANAGYGPADVSERQPGLWNLADNSFQLVDGLPEPEINETAGTIMLAPAQDQKVMFIAGGGVGDTQDASARTAIVDLASPDPTYVSGPNLTKAKRYPGAVVLPDDTVLVSGGSTAYRAKDSLTAEIYHPDTNSFTPAADPHVGRDYHSEYLLLPDGRVAVFGSNPLSDENVFETRVEVYSPPYLYKGERPKISLVPTEITRGSTITVASSQPAAKVRLIRPGAYTHVTDTEQRSVALPIVQQTAGSITLDVPENSNLLPPDWYMLFVTNDEGVPSVATWVHVG
ncbi:galactose oxidase-like domain-containing protein [Protofrankia symbiont of Coriaria ruscifolia]|uniref:Galactose oxidase n=1 Tax=Candidatus Protofrankia californiensis TaxID=1839754 RepID=A0A1C3NXD4_9ACTN|nr:galactose oxidase-like domain-containing protein [Protofrankia symbiont of Coriaria ruscifolia]SBW22185.1 galactose oxidase [Candidatus Protofrankia californiensis]